MEFKSLDEIIPFLFSNTPVEIPIPSEGEYVEEQKEITFVKDRYSHILTASQKERTVFKISTLYITSSEPIFGKGELIQDPSHIPILVVYKDKNREGLYRPTLVAFYYDPSLSDILDKTSFREKLIYNPSYLKKELDKIDNNIANDMRVLLYKFYMSFSELFSDSSGDLEPSTLWQELQ